MIKRKRLIAIALAIALLVCSVMLCIVVSAEPSAEAKLTVTDAGGNAESFSGSYDEMAAKLNSASGVSYELTLLSDATAGVGIAFSGTGAESIRIDLGGYVLTTGSLTGDLIAISNAATVDIVGGYSPDVEHGRIVSTLTNGAIISITGESDIAAEISDVAFDFKNTEGAAIKATSGGAVRLVNAEAYYTGADDTQAAFAEVSGAALTLSNFELQSGDGALLGVAAENSFVRFERASISADTVYSAGTGTTLTTINSNLVGRSSVFTAKAAITASDLIHIGGGKLSGGALISGNVKKENVKLWLATGSALLEFESVEDSVTVATAYATLGEAEEGKWILNHKNLSSYVTLVTLFVDGATPTETRYTTLGKGIVGANISTTAPTAATILLLKDNEFTGSAVTLASDPAGKGDLSIFFDLDGHTIARTTKATNMFGASGKYRLYMDGDDALGNVGTIKMHTNNGGVLYAKNSLDGSEQTVSNIKVIATNQAGNVEKATLKTSSPIWQNLTARFVFDNMDMVYTGEEYGEGDALKEALATNNLTLNPQSSTIYLMQSQSAYVTVNNCVIRDTSDLGIKNVAFNVSSGDGKIFVKNSTVEGVNKVMAVVASTTEGRIADSSVSSRGVPFTSSGKEPLVITDVEITMQKDVDVSSGNVFFAYGDGNLKIKKPGEGNIAGGFSTDEGYSFSYSADRDAYVLIDESQVTSVKTAQIFASGMVLQANKPINIWGTCETDGATITVTVGDTTASGTVVNGEWSVTLAPISYKRGVSIVIEESGLEFGKTTITNVDIGEVWLMSGQSNSVYGAYKMEDFAEYLALADTYDNIRAYGINQGHSLLEKTSSTAKWYQVNSSTITQDDRYYGISAVAYVMATRLAAELPADTPIAIIDANFNGSTVEAWASTEVMAKTGDTEYYKYMAYRNYYEANGAYPAEGASEISAWSYTPSGKLYQQMACACYNAMIAPLEGYALRGAIWYQGEGNGGSVTADSTGKYDVYFRAVRESFRTAFCDPQLPTFIIQLANYNSDRSYMRELQYALAAEDDNTYVVNSTIAGPVFSDKDLANTDPSDGMVHYARKSPLGLALAASVLENVYYPGEGFDIASPDVESIRVNGSEVIITLDRDFTLLYGDEILGFEIKGSSGEWRSATAVAEGRVITLRASGISNPVAVRYGHGRNILELEDGTELTFGFSTSASSSTRYVWDEAAGTVTITVNGEVYVIHTADPEVIRSRMPGNVIATNGNSLPVFSITLD